MNEQPGAQTPQTAPPAGAEDEISLIDLLAVLIRYRRLIIRGTALAGVLAVLVLYVLPLTGLLEVEEDTYTAEVELIVERVPPELREFIPIDPGTLLRASLTDLRTVAAVYRDFATEDELDPEMTHPRYLAYVRREVIPERLSVGWDGSTRTIRIRWKGDDPEDAVAFVDALIEYAAPSMSEEILRLLQDAEDRLMLNLENARRNLQESLVAAVERMADSPRGVSEERIRDLIEGSETGVIRGLMEAELALEALRVVTDNPSGLFMVVSNPVVLAEEPEAQGRAVRVVVTVMAAFFLLVFLAFVLQYARNIRRDPEEMAKLQSAWRRE